MFNFYSIDPSGLFASFLNTLGRLVENWPGKILAAASAVFFSEHFQMHLQLITLFVIMVVADIISKWIELSHECIVFKNPAAKPTLGECLAGVRDARHDQYKVINGERVLLHTRFIQSKAMRTQFLGKFFAYVFFLIVAGIGDLIMDACKHPELFVSLVATYVSATEFISVLENFDDAGVSVAGTLLTFAKSKFNFLTGGGERHEDSEQETPRRMR